jgi:hypothetical protein
VSGVFVVYSLQTATWLAWLGDMSSEQALEDPFCSGTTPLPIREADRRMGQEFSAAQAQLCNRKMLTTCRVADNSLIRP